MLQSPNTQIYTTCYSLQLYRYIQHVIVSKYTDRYNMLWSPNIQIETTCYGLQLYRQILHVIVSKYTDRYSMLQSPNIQIDTACYSFQLYRQILHVIVSTYTDRYNMLQSPNKQIYTQTFIIKQVSLWQVFKHFQNATCHIRSPLQPIQQTHSCMHPVKFKHHRQLVHMLVQFTNTHSKCIIVQLYLVHF